IINLCTNAAQAIGENRTGTVEIATDIAVLSAEDAQRRGLSAPGDYVRFVVRDDGAGMSPEVRERIFDPFFTTKQLGIGTGLGLSVVHGIVRGHGGSIDVRSAPGEGATFEILWPMATNTVDSKQAPTQDASPSGSEHILWIDDDAAVLEAGQELLHRLGYRVTSSRDAQEAWSAFAASPADFDLVISDQMMPKMRGDELAEKIGSVRPDARMILLTGYFNILPRRSDGPTPIRKILMKPIDPAELAAAIRAALDD
ncbi:response regulator, partial [bacterium]|nr:response regulator [bacterium]